jgi:hypothetical protein
MAADIHLKQAFSHISGSIYGLAGYCSDNDSTQHVVAATDNGDLYEIHWNSNVSPTSPQWLEHFDEIASLCSFYSSNDTFQHVIVATRDGHLHELYIMQPLPQDVYKRSPLYNLGTTLGPGIGMAGFFSSDGDNLRHATVGSKEDNTDNILHEIVWNAQVHPSARNLATQFHLREVAGIAGFFDLDVHSRDVIVAMMGGDVYDVRYSGGILGGEQITTVRVTTFSPTLDNVAAFVNTNTKVAHVIVLDKSWQLYDYTYTPHHEGLGQMTPLKNIANLLPPGPPGTRGIKDIVAYYSYYDSYCHVIVATSDGNLHEIYYYGQ